MTDDLLLLFFFLLLQLLLVNLETGVVGIDHTLDQCELLCRLCLSLLYAVKNIVKRRGEEEMLVIVPS